MRPPINHRVRFENRMSYIYLERTNIEKDEESVSAFDKNGKTQIPAGQIAVFLLGPGTTITHAAMKVLGELGCSVIWTGEEGVRFYASGKTAGNIDLLKNQARYSLDEKMSLQIAKKMFEMRFKEKTNADSIETLRSMEAVRMKNLYQELAEKNDIVWLGRTSQLPYEECDTANKALSSAYACMYGICHSAICSLGLSPSLGFIHTGDIHSFVFDVADLYKMEIAAPLAFSEAKKSDSNISQRVRQAMRDTFKETKLFKRITDDLFQLFG